MRILIHGINFSPELTGIGKYSGEMAEWLVEQGHEVRVVTSPPYYPQWRVADGYSGARYKRELVTASESRQSKDWMSSVADGSSRVAKSATPPRNDGVVVFRCPLWVPVKPSGLKRILHLLSFALSSLPVMLRQVLWRPDVVWVVEPALFCAPGAWLSARMSGAKVWLHVQDFEVDAAFDLGIVKADWLKRLVLGVEGWLVRRFDRVSTISTGMLSKLVEKGVPSEKTVLFPNWVDVEAIHPDEGKGQALRAELNLPANTRVALYSGNMGEKQGLEYVLEAAHLLKDEANLLFVMCGAGAALSRLQQAAKDLPNVRWLPLQPIEKLNSLLNMADVHLLPQKKNAADLVMPSKLTGIFASGRPVIAMAEPGTAIHEAVTGRGVNVPPENAAALAEALLNLLSDKRQCERLGIAGRQFAEATLGQAVILREFEKKLLELI